MIVEVRCITYVARFLRVLPELDSIYSDTFSMFTPMKSGVALYIGISASDMRLLNGLLSTFSVEKANSNTCSTARNSTETIIIGKGY